MPGPMVGTCFFTHGLNGWTEVYPLLAGGYAEASVSLGSILAARQDLLTSEVVNVFNRVSDITVRGDSKIVAGQGAGDYVPVSGDLSPDPVVLKLRQEAGPPLRSIRYLHGVPEEVIENGIYAPTLVFENAMTAYIAAVLAGAGILKKDAGPPVTYSVVEIAEAAVVGVWARKVGRPFGLHRGRRVTPSAP